MASASLHSKPSPLFTKLNLGTHAEVYVFDPPASFEPELRGLEGRTLRRDAKTPRGMTFALAFATRQVDVDRITRVMAAGAVEDAVLWVAYPKGTSKRYQCDFNRDTGWKVLRELGYDTVRAVAIDADWTALRFRKVAYSK